MRLGEFKLYSIIGVSKYIRSQWVVAFFAPFKISISLPWVSIFIKFGSFKFSFLIISSNVIVVTISGSKFLSYPEVCSL